MDKGDFTIDSVHRYNKKIESLNYEYNQMLAQTLENQRSYFEKRLAELNAEEDQIIAKKRHQILESEQKLREIDTKMDEVSNNLDLERDHFFKVKETFGEVLQEQMEIELDTKKMREYNKIREAQLNSEIMSLKEQIEQAEKEVSDLKLDRQDMLNHIKMSQKIKKSKNSSEIAQGQTLIFETQQKKSGRR